MVAGYVYDPYILALIYSAGMFVSGLVVYLVFYKLFHKLYGSKVRSPSRLKDEIVMCGMEYEGEELTAPISKVFTDIMRKALPRLHKGLYEKTGTGVLNDWFAWMLIILFILVAFAVFIKPG